MDAKLVGDGWQIGWEVVQRNDGSLSKLIFRRKADVITCELIDQGLTKHTKYPRSRGTQVRNVYGGAKAPSY